MSDALTHIPTTWSAGGWAYPGAPSREPGFWCRWSPCHSLFCRMQLHSYQSRLSLEHWGLSTPLFFSPRPTQCPELLFLSQTKQDFFYQPPIEL